MKPDLVSHNLGTIIMIGPLTPKGRRWLARHVGHRSWDAVPCDHRCGIDILAGARDSGLTLLDGRTGRIAS